MTVIVRTAFGSRLLGVHLIIAAIIAGYYAVNTATAFTRQGNFPSPIPLDQTAIFTYIGVSIALEFTFILLEWLLFRQKPQNESEVEQYAQY